MEIVIVEIHEVQDIGKLGETRKLCSVMNCKKTERFNFKEFLIANLPANINRLFCIDTCSR